MWLISLLLAKCGAINYFFMVYPQNYFNCSTLARVRLGFSPEYTYDASRCEKVANPSSHCSQQLQIGF
jgi:hypothetical protein